ncbi:MAG TPA: EAL domain-containing protein [Candidatus Dormibacteraeota bacterium]|nr:EAL domain-containing protein [Candidatus Dormibacteraeota bacterium]
MAADLPLDSDERASIVLSQLPAIMWTTDRELRFTSSRGSALEELGLAPDEVTGRTLYEFFQTEDPAHPSISMHLTALAGTPAAGDVHTFGRHYQCYVQPLTHAGDVVGTVGIAVDVTDHKRVEDAYRQQVDLTHAITSCLADGLVAVDPDLRITFVNEAAERLLGWTAPEILGRQLYAVTHAESEPDVPIRREDSQILRAMRTGEPNHGSVVTPVYYRHRDGTRFPILGAAAPIVTAGSVLGAVVSFRDVSDFYAMQQELIATTERARRREQELKTLWDLLGRQDLDRDALAHAILVEGGRTLGLDRGSIVHVQGDFCVVDYLENFGDPSAYASLPLAESAAELAVSTGKTFSATDLTELPEVSARRAVQRHGLRAYIGTTFSVERRTYVLSFASSDPRSRPFDADDHTYVESLAAFFGRHLQAAEQQERIVQLASIDPLTGLQNRAFFARQVGHRITFDRASGERCAVLAVGLDHFKEVNSALGHGVGDRVLMEASSRLRRAVRGEATLARLGDDEFAVLLPRLNAPLEAERAARHICGVLAAPYAIGDERVHLTASVGVAICEDSLTRDDLLLRADVAMHGAKRDGRNRFCFYNNDLALHLSRRRELENGMRAAIARQEFYLAYQPIVNLISHAVVGAEALIRWNRPGHGIVRPDDFIGLAEESGLIVPIGAWTLTTACAQAQRWASLGMALRVAVNISARQLQDAAFISEIEDALAQSGVDPTLIGLEITESVAIGDLLATRSILQRCKDLGLRVALDDFGTSYSSLAYLRELPIDTIKVDRRFVEGLPADRTSAAITRAIVAFGTSLGFDTLGEGVETVEQERWLAREGCRTAQGYLFAKPMPAEEFEAWLAAWPRRSAVT